MFVALMHYALGLLVGATLALMLVWRRNGKAERAARALLLAAVPFIVPILLMSSHLGPTKSITNLAEFSAYGFIAGLIPLGQFVHWFPKSVPGEVALTVAACVLVASVYMLIPTLAETRLG